MPRMIVGSESTVKLDGYVAIKTYNKNARDWDKRFSRTPECETLRNYKSEYFIPLIDANRDSITTARGEGCLGGTCEFGGIHFARSNKDKLCEWLVGLREELNRLELHHRDVHPGNIVKFGDDFRLIDFCWATKDPSSPRSSGLNSNYFLSDKKSINKMLMEIRKTKTNVTIAKEKIKRIGLNFHPGSSVSAGVTYHPIPLPDFSEVRSHKKNCYTELNQILNILGDFRTEELLVDVGSSVGFFSLSLMDMFKHVKAIEPDILAARSLGHIAKTYSLPMAVDNSPVSDKIPKCHTALFLNAHMWVWQREGRERTIEIMRGISKRCHQIFFQTSHAQSAGMYIIKELADENAIVEHLQESGFTNIEKVATNNHDGKPRFMFMANGQN
jgi:hypothetical protein